MANIIVDIPVIKTAPYRVVMYHTVLYDYTILKTILIFLRTERTDSTSLRLYNKYIAAERLNALYRQNLGVPLGHRA